MDPARWLQVEPILDEALDLPREVQAAFLDERCGHDPVLRREVAELLAACQDSEEEMVSPLAHTDLLRRLFDEAPAEMLPAGTRLGPYRVLHEIGEGGMGRVYLAERADGAYDKQVAIKVIKRGMDTDAVVRRFRHERQILAHLDHPHIARLLDGGVSADGLPFFVMEHVDGERMDRYCDRQRLSVEARLRLFLVVCEAVRYAHRNLVVHRDLKPANVLVAEGPGGQPTVKLLDFGIAKLVGPQADGETMMLTAATDRRMTLAYAAPEQVLGQPITTATDVYALGIILYELLSGRRPYHVDTVRPSEVEAVICDRLPERPSAQVRRAPTHPLEDTTQVVSEQRGTEPRLLHQRLSGDLDAIVMTALRKEPGARYASAADLMADVQRHLDGLPVTAREPTLSYRLTSFVRRYTLAVALTAAVFVALMGGILTTTWQFRVAVQEREARAVEAAAAEEAFAYLTTLLADVNPNEARGHDLRVEDLLQTGIDRLDDLNAQPLAKAKISHELARLALNLSRFDTADSLFALTQALREAELPVDHPDLLDTISARGLALFNQGQRTDALALLRTAVAHWPAPERSSLAQAELRTNLAYVLLHADSTAAEAEAIYRDLAHRFRHPATSEGDTVRWATLLAESHDGVGDLTRFRGDVDGALTAYREALAIRTTHLPPNDPYVGDSQARIALVLLEQAAYPEAERLLLDAIALQQDVYGPDHYAVGSKHEWLGQLYVRTDRLDRATHHYSRAADAYWALGLHGYALDAWHRLGRAQLEQGVPAAALATAEDALARPAPTSETSAAHEQLRVLAVEARAALQANR
ncbi:MAG: protein kinase [Bacteroidota bacterium]